MGNLGKNGLERLLGLPLLQGLSQRDLLDIAGRARFNFSKLEARHRLVRQDARANRLCFVLDGKIIAERRSLRDDYVLTEWLAAPLVIQPEGLFSWHTHWTRTFSAATDCSLLEVDRDTVRDIFLQYAGFRENYLNFLGHLVQHNEEYLWCTEGEDVAERFALFLRRRCMRSSGRKELRMERTSLAHALGVSQARLSRTLHILSEKGLLDIRRGGVDIPDLSELPGHIPPTR